MATTYQQQLMRVLARTCINHHNEIMKEPSIKHAHVYCKIQGLSGQITGPLIEKYIQYKCNMSKNHASQCIGDLQHNGCNLEIKVSNGGQNHNKFNYVQMRMNHQCDYLLTAYYLDDSNVSALGDLFLFRISKHDLRQIIAQYGSYAHGTKEKLGAITLSDLENQENTKEYALRPKYGDECWKSLLPFRIEEFAIQTNELAASHGVLSSGVHAI